MTPALAALIAEAGRVASHVADKFALHGDAAVVRRLAAALRRAERVVEAARVLDRLATPPMQSAAWDTLDAALRAHDHPDATGGTGREGGS